MGLLGSSMTPTVRTDSSCTRDSSRNVCQMTLADKTTVEGAR